MMVFTVRDAVADRFLEPFFLPNEGTARRSFSEAVNSPGHQFNKYPEDYALYVIGSFDEEAGVLTPCEARKLVNAGNVLMVSAPEAADFPEFTDFTDAMMHARREASDA